MPKNVRIKKPGPGAGPRKLLEYIRSLHEGGIPKFCERHGLNRFRVEKAIKRGGPVDVDFATSIERATNGHVQVPDWVTPDAAE